jgi:hypothetical protein
MNNGGNSLLDYLICILAIFIDIGFFGLGTYCVMHSEVVFGIISYVLMWIFTQIIIKVWDKCREDDMI